MVELKLNTHMNLLNPDCVKGWRSGSGVVGEEGQDDGGPQASHRGALAPSPPGPPSAPHWLHHDSRWCWAGRARCLQIHRNRRTDKTTHGVFTYIQPAPARLALISHNWALALEGLLPPWPDLSRKRTTGKGGEGPGRWVVVTRSR